MGKSEKRGKREGEKKKPKQLFVIQDRAVQGYKLYMNSTQIQ